MFSDVGPDIRWVGNESGIAGDTCWSTINTEGMAPGKADPKYLNTGDPNGKFWIPAETDVSIRPGWFWHQKENDKVKSPQDLVNLYYTSVGRNSLLLLNIPPNNEGLFEETDIRSIKAFRAILDETFKNNLATRGSKRSLTDKKTGTFVTLKENQPLIIDFKKPVKLDRAMIQENIANGQVIENGTLEYWTGSNWNLIANFSTVGYKRLLRFDEVEAQKIRLTVLKAKSKIQLAEVGFYKSSAAEAMK
jgi:alpha-L-fucosidase